MTTFTAEEHEELALDAFAIEQYVLDPDDPDFAAVREALRPTFEFRCYLLRSQMALARAEIAEDFRRLRESLGEALGESTEGSNGDDE